MRRPVLNFIHGLLVHIAWNVLLLSLSLSVCLFWNSNCLFVFEWRQAKQGGKIVIAYDLQADQHHEMGRRRRSNGLQSHELKWKYAQIREKKSIKSHLRLKSWLKWKTFCCLNDDVWMWIYGLSSWWIFGLEVKLKVWFSFGS